MLCRLTFLAGVSCFEEISVSVSRRDQTWRDRDQDPRDRDRELTPRDRDRDRDHENVVSRGLETETWSRDLTSLLDTVNDLFLTQHVQGKTRGDSILDLVLSTEKD